jgi:hypothetical protein
VTFPKASAAVEPEIQPEDIRAVECLIRPYIRLTPVVELRGQDFGLGNISLILKL